MLEVKDTDSMEVEEKTLNVIASLLEMGFEPEMIKNYLVHGLENIDKGRKLNEVNDLEKFFVIKSIENAISFKDIDGYFEVTKDNLGNEQKIEEAIEKAKEMNKEQNNGIDIYDFEEEQDDATPSMPTEAEQLEIDEQEDIEEGIEAKDDEVKNLSPKGQKLLEKVDKLCEKIEQEKNPLKLHLLKFQVRMLQAKIQRELDLINLKEDYQTRREALKNNKDMKDNENIVSVAELAEQIRSKKRKLNSNRDYDYEDSEFLYPKNIVESKGGIEQLVESLKQSDSPAAQSTAKRIEDVSKIRQELNELENQLEEKQNSLDQSDKEYSDEQRKLNFEEKRLTVVNKMNIFSRVGDFFKAIGAGIKDFREERAAMKTMENELKEQEEEIKNEYKRRMEELKVEREAAKESKSNERKEKFLNEIHLTGEDLNKANEPAQIEQLTNEKIVEDHLHDDDAQSL